MYPDSLFQITAFGLTGVAITHQLHSLGIAIPLIFIDTLHHFPSTLELMERVAQSYTIKVHIFKPLNASTQDEFIAEYEDKLWETNPDKYDYLVKAEPAHRAYDELQVRAVITGRRRSQGGSRNELQVLELDYQQDPPIVKINPMANANYDQVWNYIQTNKVPYNVLVDQGYKSIGDVHSTVPVQEGESERAGRWKGETKTECGLHKDYFKMKRSGVSEGATEGRTEGNVSSVDPVAIAE
jgi:phosphoadenosine phosphosulfate reductase